MFSVDPAANASAGFSFVMVEQAIAERTTIQTRNVREIHNVQVPHLRVGL